MEKKKHFIESYPLTRMRRNRSKAFSRRLIKENSLSVDDLILPLFITSGKNIEEEINSMPGVFRLSPDRLLKLLEAVVSLDIPAIALFPYIDKELKNSSGTHALDDDNLVCQTVRLIKKEFPELGVICDVALDPYTDHGHDGIIINNDVDNDKTVEILTKQALNQAAAGCDIVAPSDMMDGRVAAIRKCLDKNQYINTQIMSYAAKYASSFYGPFRDAVGSNLKHNNIDKSSYQMGPENSDEAIREVSLDISEGADMVIIKPGMPYLDIISRVKKECNIPVFAYQVSGEYSMIALASKNGYFDLEGAMMESLISFKRSGADGIFSYFSIEAAKILKSNK
tara:strand:+ start:441 stop:1457 length:1017 start_codon:yes stop_codon:yes gene_type:complete